MATRIILQPALVLHTRPYRDSSLLVDLFTLPQGRVTAIAAAARQLKSRFRGLLRPFLPLLATWSGRTELMNLSHLEASALAFELNGRSLLSGMYLNELLLRLLPRHDAHPGLFTAYQQSLIDLQQPNSEYALRVFEKKLLDELGYGLQLHRDVTTGAIVKADEWYSFQPNKGVEKCNVLPVHCERGLAIFQGKHLLALHNDDFSDADTLRAAKQLMRLAIESLLGDKPLHSRKLFMVKK